MLQEAMSCATMDAILAVGSFGLDIDALHSEPCEPLEHLQYCIAEGFRCRRVHLLSILPIYSSSKL